jgi:hypothetical protein
MLALTGHAQRASFIGCIMPAGIAVNNAILLSTRRTSSAWGLLGQVVRGRAAPPAADPHDGDDDDARPPTARPSASATAEPASPAP